MECQQRITLFTSQIRDADYDCTNKDTNYIQCLWQFCVFSRQLSVLNTYTTYMNPSLHSTIEQTFLPQFL